MKCSLFVHRTRLLCKFVRVWRKASGHAVLCAHPVVGDEPVAVILPDVILDEYESDLSQDNLAEMIRRFDETGHSQIMVEPVADVIRIWRCGLQRR